MSIDEGITRELAIAWIVTVINPILDGLRDEEMILENGRTTWRSGPDRCELLRPCGDYIRSTYLPNFKDLVDELPGVRDLVERHDAAVASLNLRLREARDAVLVLPEFKALCEVAVARPGADLDGPTPAAILLVDAVLDDLAESSRFIADTRDLRYRRLWEVHGDSFRTIRAAGPVAEALKVAGEALDSLLAATRALRAGLEDQRRLFRKRFGIPSVPIGMIEPTADARPS